MRGKEQHPGYSLPAAVDWTYASACRMERCRVSHTGASGIGLAEGCRDNEILGCEVADTGGHGIHVGMPHGPICIEDFAWKREQDEPRDNRIRHCYVHHVGEMDWGAYGIHTNYTQRTLLANNEVAFTPYSGICAAFTLFAFPSTRDETITIERNYVHHVVSKLKDAGGLYLKDRVSKESVLRGNVIHDVGGNARMNNGIFLDDGSAGYLLEDNVIFEVAMPIRFNRCGPRNFTWGSNYVSTGPSGGRSGDPKMMGTIVTIPKGRADPQWPHAIADRVGPAEEYRKLWASTEEEDQHK
jgi:hypothetical protein